MINFLKRFVTWLSSIVTRLSTKQPEIVNQIVNPDGVINNYILSINSLYKHKVFEPKPKKDITKIYDDVWYGKKQFDCSKTHYKLERPTFYDSVSRRFGRGG